jgi:surface antigen
MRLGRLFAIFIALWVSSTFASAARADAPYEGAVQYALEYLTSGISTASTYKGTEVEISGHYCRQYEITVTEPATDPNRDERTRCRDGDGKWKRVKEN